jgi:DivIVA domain-containing protein
MNDEAAFHLTPSDVRSREFQRGFRGYDPDQVDGFKAQLADELERMIRDKAKMEERLQGFQEQLRAFRERERAMNEALLAAQQLRVAAVEQAEREGEAILREARADALRLVGQAADEERQIRERQEMLQRQFAAYLANFRALLERQLGEVEGLQAHAQLTHLVQTELLLKRHA